MDRVEQDREIIKRIIREYASFLPSYSDVQVETIFDDERGHYLLVHTGWDGKRRVHGSAIHIDLRGDKIWVQHDGTKEGVVDELVAAGIPRDRIVLLDRRFTRESFALALARNDDDFRLLVDRALSKLYASPDFQALYRKWFGEFDEGARQFFLWNTPVH